MKGINNIESYHQQSKLWIYTVKENLTDEMANEISNRLEAFCQSWTAHNKELRAFWNMYENRIILLGVDEHLNPASGCSIDKSVHLLQDLEKEMNINIFDRMLFSYTDGNNIYTLSRDEFQQAIDEQKIDSETMVVNTLAKNLEEWTNIGIQKLQNSWMKNLFNIKLSA
jgi:hypothetical protein